MRASAKGSHTFFMHLSFLMDNYEICVICIVPAAGQLFLPAYQAFADKLIDQAYQLAALNAGKTLKVAVGLIEAGDIVAAELAEKGIDLELFGRKAVGKYSFVHKKVI